MRIPCWIAKATNTRSHYVTLIVHSTSTRFDWTLLNVKFFRKKIFWTYSTTMIYTSFVWKIFSFQETLSEIRSNMYIGLQVKYRYCCQVLLYLNFLDKFSKNTQIPIFIKKMGISTNDIWNDSTLLEVSSDWRHPERYQSHINQSTANRPSSHREAQ